jgi:hypothetical protein
MDPISKLDQKLWDCCVRQRGATDDIVAKRWEHDPLAYQQEGFVIEPMPSSMQPLVDQAVTQWKQIEEKVCSNLKMSREQFIDEFEKARSSFRAGNNEWKKFVRQYGPAVYGAVLNMDVVNLFTWILPAADTDRQEAHRSIGRMVAAFFYTELLYKSEQAVPDDSTFLKMEARWSLVNKSP